MQALIAGVVAAFVGILVGFWLRTASAKAEKALLERRSEELAGEVTGIRVELTLIQAESAARAGFESLATEREKTIGQLATEQDGLREELRAKRETERTQTARISQLEAELKSERDGLQEKLALLESAKQALANQFEALAGEILEKKSKSFSEGSQKELGTLLTPLRDQIKEFRDKVEQAQTDSKTGVTKLETLIGTLGGLNQQLSEEAHNLTTALRGSSKAQGDWGEFILRDLLEKAGLREGEQFTFQQTFSGVGGEDGEKAKSSRTDVIVHLPGGRHLIIDSKVSLVDYTDYVNAGAEELRQAALKQHLASMRKHLSGLAKVQYHNLPGIESPDFVVMFVPVEPALLTALQNDASLWADAYSQGALLVGPTTLLYIIRIVDVLWKQEAQSRNVQQIVKRGRLLYEKFVGFMEDMKTLGESLQKARDSYDGAVEKLTKGSGNLVGQSEKLRRMKIDARKRVPAKFLDLADLDEEPELLLAAEAEDSADDIA